MGDRPARFLITGAAGQLGRELLATLPGELHGVTHEDLDITDRDAVFRSVSRIMPHWVINTAAFNDVDRAETDRELAFAVNALAPGHLADAAASVGASILHLSSDYVFDGRKGAPYTEDDRPDPVNVYGRSKYEGELRVLASSASHCIIRTAWLYGMAGRNFVSAIQVAARTRLPIKVVSDQVGSPTSATDLAAAIALLIATPVSGTLHVTNTGACSRYEFARAILGNACEVVPIGSDQAGRPARRPANSSLTSVRWEAAGFRRLRSWEAALADHLERVMREERPAA